MLPVIVFLLNMLFCAFIVPVYMLIAPPSASFVFAVILLYVNLEFTIDENVSYPYTAPPEPLCPVILFSENVVFIMSSIEFWLNNAPPYAMFLVFCAVLFVIDEFSMINLAFRFAIAPPTTRPVPVAMLFVNVTLLNVALPYANFTAPPVAFAPFALLFMNLDPYIVLFVLNKYNAGLPGLLPYAWLLLKFTLFSITSLFMLIIADDAVLYTLLFDIV